TSVFQHELYVSIRGVVGINSKHEIFVETGKPDDNRRLGIADARGARDLLYGYEFKLKQLTKADIVAAVKQADEFRQRLAVSATLLVNFVPRSYALDEVYRVDGYPDISIVHVRFPASCDEYELRFVGQDSDIANRTIRSSE
uniref:Uncharacterized protein n=1 Tax=Globisporangium ultimum (strain ATCC 200006 / CBS 805.95 / DAOM BR144) TaxID=431595 RepID=K3WEK4_GLOUD